MGNLNKIIFTVAVFGAGAAMAADKCQLVQGNGCGGPVVYEMQLCLDVTLSGGLCNSLCQQAPPICNVTDFDNWISAYSRKGYGGLQGPLATTNSFDQSGQLTQTSGSTYTVCLSHRGLIGGWSDASPVSAPKTCPLVQVPSASTCKAGTTFNNNPTSPQCITQNSYCAGGGASGDFATTMNAGFTMVAVQNAHFVNTAPQDTTPQTTPVLAGTTEAGISSITAGTIPTGLAAAPFVPSNPAGGTSSSSNTPNTAAALAGSAGTTATATGSTVPSSSSGNINFAAGKSFAMDGGTFQAGSGGAFGTASGSGGAGAFGGASAGVTAGGAAGDVGFEAAGASRGLASGDHLAIQDPENYFMLSDVETSLFKRVTAQFRKKERSLVLTP